MPTIVLKLRDPLDNKGVAGDFDTLADVISYLNNTADFSYNNCYEIRAQGGKTFGSTSVSPTLNPTFGAVGSYTFKTLIFKTDPSEKETPAILLAAGWGFRMLSSYGSEPRIVSFEQINVAVSSIYPFVCGSYGETTVMLQMTDCNIYWKANPYDYGEGNIHAWFMWRIGVELQYNFVRNCSVFITTTSPAPSELFMCGNGATGGLTFDNNLFAVNLPSNVKLSFGSSFHPNIKNNTFYQYSSGKTVTPSIISGSESVFVDNVTGDPKTTAIIPQTDSDEPDVMAARDASLTMDSTPCLNNADPTLATPTDVRGVTRPQGAVADRGAYELIPTSVSDPTIDPEGGSFTTSQEVELACETEGAEIHYTLDGSTPTEESALYSVPFNITESLTFKAKAFKEGLDPSNVITAFFIISVATPTIDPDGGSFIGSQEITLACTTPGAAIHYTTNGSTPTEASTLYSEPFSITSSLTIKAKAFKENLEDSGVESAEFAEGIPVLFSPDDEAVNVAVRPTFECSKVAGTNKYEIQVASDEEFTSIDFSYDNIPSPEGDTVSYQITSNLQSSHVYYWRMRAWDNETPSDWSSVRSFTTLALAPGKPVLRTPVNFKQEQNPEVEFVWDGAVNAQTYALQISKDPTFATLIVNQTGLTSTTYLTTLENYMLYFWRVRGINDGQEAGDWSDSFLFRTSQPAVVNAPAASVGQAHGKGQAQGRGYGRGYGRGNG